MRAAIINAYGDVPELSEFQEPEAGAGQTVVELSVAGLNPVDLSLTAGQMPSRMPELPAVVGLEGIGTAGGRRVYFDSPVPPFGSFAERSLVADGDLIEVPDGIEDETAICFGIAGMAAWLALTWRAHLEPGERVLVLGASGVVGQIAVQAARLLGAGRVVAAARSEESLRRAEQDLGADATVRVTEADDLADRLQDAADGEGFDVVLDPIWGAPATAAIDALAVNGRLIQIGNAASPNAELPAKPFRNKLASIIGHTNFRAPADLKADAFLRMCEHALAGELKVDVKQRELGEIADAWKQQEESPHHKLVLNTTGA